MDLMARIDHSKTLIGWKEWISLPELGIYFIKAKIDTGARTSAIHASSLKIKTERGQRIACFTIKPLAKRNDVIVACEAPVIDERVVSDSSGKRERRYVISTQVHIGGRSWPIEITLANRETMSAKMLLGRQAMKYLMVEPSKTYLLGKPKNLLKSYGTKKKKRPETIKKKARKSSL